MYKKEIEAMIIKLSEKFIKRDKEGFGKNGLAIPFSEIIMLSMIKDGMSIEECLTCFGISRKEANALMRKFLSDGLLDKEKDAIDKRRTNVFLTAKGRGMLESFASERDKVMDVLLEDMTYNEERAVLKFLSKVNQLTVEKYTIIKK